MASSVITVGDGGTKSICAPPPGDELPLQAGAIAKVYYQNRTIKITLFCQQI